MVEITVGYDKFDKFMVTRISWYHNCILAMVRLLIRGLTTKYPKLS